MGTRRLRRGGDRSRPRRAIAAVALAVAASVTAGSVVLAPASADPVTDRKKQLDRQVAQIRDSLEGTSQDLVDAAVALETAKVDLVGARATLATARDALAEAQRRDAEIATQLDVAKAEERKAQRELAAGRQAEAQTRSTLGRIAREVYLTSGTSGLAVAMDATSPADFADRLAVVGTALRAQNGAIARLDVQQAETRAQQARLEAVREQVAELKRRSEQSVRVRAAAEAAATDAEAQVAGLVDAQTRAVSTIEAKKAAEQNRLDALEQEQVKLKAILVERARRAAEEARRKAAEEARRKAAEAAKNRSSGSSGSSGSGSGSSGSGSSGSGTRSGYLSRPAAGPVTSGFGYRIHPIFHTRRLHTGTDFGVPCGTAVRAAADGQVVLAGWAGGYGNRVVIDHGYVRGVGLATTYNHLSRYVVRSGSVSRGQVIAYSGTTGSSTGCHLHFEVLVNGGYVNPMGWL